MPLFPLSPNPTTINMFFLKTISPPTGMTGTVYGLSNENGNGVTIAQGTFFPTLTGRPDTTAHEAGHDFNLNHMILGADGTPPAPPPPPADNLLSDGSTRTVPSPLITSGQAQWVPEVSPNSSSISSPPALDQFTLGASGSQTQQGQALLSGFLNATPQAYMSLFPEEEEEDDSVQTAASAQSAAANNASNSTPPIDFDVTVEPTYSATGTLINSNVSLAEIIIILTQGKFDNSSGNSFSVIDQSITPLLAGPPQISHGNNGNGACENAGPTTWCLDLQFVPGAFTSGNYGNYLDFTIGTKPASTNGLQGTVCYFWQSSPGIPYYSSCADLVSYDNGYYLYSASQLVNLAMNPLLPANFMGTPGSTPCTDPPCTQPLGVENDFTSSGDDPADRREPTSQKR